MDMDWNKLTPAEFEQLCGMILEANNFTDIQWFGASGNDKGRDILAKKLETPLSGIQIQATWVIQSKRYLTRPPAKSELNDFLNAAREHKPDKVLIAITNTLSSNTKDWLESIRNDYRFQIYLWEERDLLREVHNHKGQISERFPGIYRAGEPVYMYQRHPYEFRFSCNEFEEIEILIFNKLNIEEAKQEAIAFLNYIRQNGIEWWDDAD